MSSLLLIGFLIGMRHAMEADHVAAVASLVTRGGGLVQTVRLGVVWGLGHSLTLFLFGSVVLVLGQAVPDRLAHWLEFAVGVMLVGLGIDVLRRLMRERIHFHVHRHDDGTRHFHAHSHRDDAGRGASRHRHSHPEGFPFRALLIGLMHGMAGSAALILLTLESIRSPWLGLLYIALFGIGSMVGMAILSAIIAVPFRYSARGLTRLNQGLQAGVGSLTLALGGWVMLETGAQLAGAA